MSWSRSGVKFGLLETKLKKKELQSSRLLVAKSNCRGVAGEKRQRPERKEEETKRESSRAYGGYFDTFAS
ncbi:hypothetical protein O6P43_013982 [Quillaja saponaria]|uniref:Uncharacterized protein n=1 Tax=Quillaja saponaria TaxID=32244 RepID=A0AAD7LTU8_QUISA|nr:hypothetical protein O6P43_013982 [Quillaja saponaria]